MQILVRDNNVDQALRALKKKLQREGVYREIAPDGDGILRSQVFPGLWLDPKAALNHDGARLLDVVDLGLRSPEHGEFVKKLAEARRPA